MAFRKDTGNRALNTIWAVTRRPAGTVLNTVTDAAKTALYGVLDPIDWFGQTAWKIKDAVHKSFTEWSFWKKLRRAPASLLATPFMAIEWAAETLLNTTWNIGKHTLQTIAHPFINVWNTIKWIGSKQPVWNFRFTNIDNRSKVTPKNRLASKFS